MKYHLEIDVPEKEIKKSVLVRMPKPVYDEFYRAAHAQGTDMTTVIKDMIKEFSKGYRKAMNRQPELPLG